MIVRIQNRRGLKADWEGINPVLASGEFGYESDAGGLKIGDGVSEWNDLEYSNAEIFYFDGNDFEGSGTKEDKFRLRR